MSHVIKGGPRFREHLFARTWCLVLSAGAALWDCCDSTRAAINATRVVARVRAGGKATVSRTSREDYAGPLAGRGAVRRRGEAIWAVGMSRREDTAAGLTGRLPTRRRAQKANSDDLASACSGKILGKAVAAGLFRKGCANWIV